MVNDYTVWVGGIEVNDTLMPLDKAETLANIYRLRGYEDVHVESYCSISPQLKSYLWQEFSKNNLPKYYKYFEQWINNLTNNQVSYFIAYMLNLKTCINK